MWEVTTAWQLNRSGSGRIVKLTLAALSLWVTVSTLNCGLRSTSNFLWNVSLILRQQCFPLISGVAPIDSSVRSRPQLSKDQGGPTKPREKDPGDCLKPPISHFISPLTDSVENIEQSNEESDKRCLKFALVVACPICEVIKCLTESLQPDRPKPSPDHDGINLLSNKLIGLAQLNLQNTFCIAGFKPQTIHI